jgi:purine-binding chemotaxis protein CheW
MATPLSIEAASRESETEEQHQYLSFRLGDETYALGILGVKEIIEYGGLTAVPMMPSFVRGVLNLRGRVVPVIDLSLRFARQPTVPSRRTCIVIVEVMVSENRQDLGVMVDAVNQVIEILPADIAPSPAFGTNIRTEFIEGMGKVDGKFVIVLNVEKVFSIEEMALIGPMHEALPAPQPAAH